MLRHIILHWARNNSSYLYYTYIGKALSQRSDISVTIGSNLFSYNLNDYDLVCGSRFLKGGFSTTYFRHYCSKIFNLFVNFITRGKISDNMSGFFIIKKFFLNNMLDKIFYGYGDFYIRLLFYMQKKNLRIRETAVRYAPRKFGQSKSKFVKMLFLYSLEAAKLIFKNK